MLVDEDNCNILPLGELLERSFDPRYLCFRIYDEEVLPLVLVDVADACKKQSRYRVLAM